MRHAEHCARLARIYGGGARVPRRAEADKTFATTGPRLDGRLAGIGLNDGEGKKKKRKNEEEKSEREREKEGITRRLWTDVVSLSIYLSVYLSVCLSLSVAFF